MVEMGGTRLKTSSCQQVLDYMLSFCVILYFINGCNLLSYRIYYILITEELLFQPKYI